MRLSEVQEPRLWVCLEVNTPIISNTTMLEFIGWAGGSSNFLRSYSQASYITGVNEVRQGQVLDYIDISSYD